MSRIPDALARELVAIPDAGYGRIDAARLRELRKAAVDRGVEGLALGCPTRITGAALPLLVLYARDALRIAEVIGELNELVLAAPLGRGLVAVAPLRAQRSDKRPMVDAQGRPERPIAPDPDEEPIKVTTVEVEQVGDRLRLPDVGRYALRVLSWDWASNAAVTTLDRTDDDDPPVDPRWSLDDAHAVHAPLDAWRRYGAPLPTADRMTVSPTVEGLGLALSVPARTVSGAESIPVYGSLRVALPPEAAVVPAWRAAPPEGVDAAALPCALFSAALLFVQRDELKPLRVDLTVPVYAAVPAKPGDVVEGWFGINLAQVLRAPLRPGKHCAYLVIGEHLSGPHAVEVLPG
jgi:hypothetical protein